MNQVHLPTIGGSIEALNYDLIENRQWIGAVNQADILAPVFTEIKNDFGSPLVPFYGGIGAYSGTILGAFAGGKTDIRISQDIKFNGTTGLNVIATMVANDDTIGIKVKHLLSNDQFPNEVLSEPLNNLLLGNILTITNWDVSTLTAEDEFNNILNKMDANQTSLFIKAVIRKNGVVTEVDGKAWRKTGVFATSSKVIES